MPGRPRAARTTSADLSRGAPGPASPDPEVSPMLKLARWSTTHRMYVVLGWVVLLVAVNALAQSAGTAYSNNFTLPNSDAQRASDLLQRSFPAQAGDRDTIVFKVASGTVLDPAVQGAHERDVRARRKAAARRRRDQPVRRRRIGQVGLGQRSDRLRDRRVRRKSQRPAQERAPNASSPSRARRRAPGCRSSSAARRSRRPSRPASASPRRSGCSRRSSCCC